MSRPSDRPVSLAAFPASSRSAVRLTYRHARQVDEFDRDTARSIAWNAAAELAPMFVSTAAAQAAFEAQGPIKAGTPGFWRVWGATPRHIKTGDLLVTSPDGPDGDLHFDLVLDTFKAKADPIRIGYVSAEAGRVTIGAMAPCVILRWETHNTLAPA